MHKASYASECSSEYASTYGVEKKKKKVRALTVKLITIKIKRMFITNIFNLKIQANLLISQFFEFNFLKCKESKINEALKSVSA